MPWDLLIKDVLPEYHKDLDYIVEMLDWDANVEPEFRRGQPRFPKPVTAVRRDRTDGYREQWVTYGTGWYSAKELTVLPKRTRDDQGHRRVRHHPDAGLRPVRHAAGLDAVDDPLRTDDGRRAVRDRRCRERRRHDRESAATRIRWSS